MIEEKKIDINASFIFGLTKERGEKLEELNKYPHIAFIGKSNVGKSSTLNSLLKRKKLVKIGKTPGKTKEINFFLVSFKKEGEKKQMYFVDLPGYGYAKVSKEMKKKIKERISWYLKQSKKIKIVVLIIDARRGLKEKDIEYIQLLNTFTNKKIKIILAVNKIETLTQKERHKLKKMLEEKTKEYSFSQIIFYSALKKKNIHLLREAILNLI